MFKFHKECPAYSLCILSLRALFVHFQVEFELTKLPANSKLETANLIWYEPDNTIVGSKEEWINVISDKED